MLCLTQKTTMILPWSEKDFVCYIDHCKHQRMLEDPTSYLFQKKVINFDIIHHECRGDPLEGSYEDYRTIKNGNFKKFPKNDEEQVLSGIFCNIKRDDLWVRRDLMVEYFKKNLNGVVVFNGVCNCKYYFW